MFVLFYIFICKQYMGMNVQFIRQFEAITLFEREEIYVQ